MAYDPSIFNTNPYYDDFDASKGFLRVLFKPGYALQARELTQLQTVLQDQISKIGDHIFKDGSRIVGGSISVRNVSYVSVDVGTETSLSGVSDYSGLVGGLLEPLSVAGAVNSSKAKVVHYINPDYSTDRKLILVVDFISGTNLGSTFKWTKTGVATSYTLASSPVTGFVTTGNCKLLTISEGIFYIDGFFVRNTLQNFTPFRVNNNVRDFSFNNFSDLSKKIGFSLVRDSVTEQEDNTLRDPAIGSYNYNAPGSDRYKINLVLSQLDFEQASTDFVELLKFQNGRITKRVDRVSYGEIERVFARRTYDESGSYTVKPFEVTIKPNNSDTSQFNAFIGSGKAYLYGYELDNQYPQVIGISRARETQIESNKRYPFSVGNWLGVSMGASLSPPGGFTFGYGQTLSTKLSTVAQGSAIVRFRRGPINTPGSVVATGYVHGYDPELSPGVTSTNARLYLYGISGSISGASIGYIYEHASTSTSLGNTIGQFAPISGDSFSGLSNTDDQSLVYEITPGYAIKDFSYLKIWTKLGSDGINPNNSSSTPQTTTYTVDQSSFSNTTSSTSSSLIQFDDYGAASSPADTNKLSAIRIVNAGGLGYAPALVPGSGLNGISLYNNNTTPGTGFILAIKPAVAGFTSGSVKVICPVIYTPSFALNPETQYRIKTASNNSQTFVSTNFTTDGSRKYYPLQNTDVFKITRVYGISGSEQIDLTSDFELDDGQREAFYDNSRLYIKPTIANQPRYTNTTGSLSITVEYTYFNHTGLPYAPFIGSMSYISHPYEQIPLYTNKRTGKTVSLANCLDFRRSGITSSTPMIKPYGRMEFGVNEDTIVSYTHYLPRIDKLCVKKDTQDGSPLFFVVQGTPDMSPIAPPDPTEGLVISTLTVPAYTHNTSDITITTNNTKRYTMADIGKIQQRVDDVEVFAKLSLSESEIEARSLRTSPTSNEPIKTSIYSDQLYGHSVSDVSSSEHICSIDFERGELRPFFTSSRVSLLSSSLVSTNTTTSADGVVSLEYVEENHLENNQYTKTISVNPSNNVNWLGFMKLTNANNVGTQVIPFYDTGFRPVVRTNSLMENDNWLSSNASNLRGFGTQWNDWESLWTGIEDVQEEQDSIQKQIFQLARVSSTSAVPMINSGNVRVAATRNTTPIDEKNRSYIRARSLKNRITRRIGSKVIDQTVVPFIPVMDMKAIVTGLKPNTTGLSLYFDGDLMVPDISTDENGGCTVPFTIPANIYLAGEKTVRISDSANIENCTMSADSVLYCSGLLEQRDSGSYSTRPPELRRQSVASETISKDPFNRNIDTLQNTNWSDPLSQTFYVDKNSNPEGVFISSVSLFFSSKDQTLPVTIQIRPTVSGYPSPSVVMPFSTVTKIPTDVNLNSASTSTPTETKFVFSTPVYLEPGEYSICVLTNSSDYFLYAADSALDSIGGSGRVGGNQLVGSLYTQQGIGVAVQDNTTNIMFSVERCKFNVLQGTLNYNLEIPQTHLFKIQTPEILPSGCTITRSFALIPFENGETVYPQSAVASGSINITYSIKRGANTAVSPVVDMQAQYGQVFTLTPVSEYVSRVVELPEALASNGITVFLDGNVPDGAGVNVSYRYVGIGEAELFGKTWIPLTQNTPQFTSVSELDFRELRYSNPTLLPGEKFKGYQIKITMNASTPTGTVLSYFKTPAVKNIRIVSSVL